MIHEPAAIRELCSRVSGLDGDAAEIGVWRGEGAKLICELLPTSTVHLFDTFDMPPVEMWSEEHDLDRRNLHFRTSVPHVEETLSGLSNFEIHQGVFPVTAIDDVRLKFVHVDCDFYLSTKAALEWAWEHLVPNGIVLDDDYGIVPGAKRAVDEWYRDNGGGLIGGKWGRVVWFVKPEELPPRAMTCGQVADIEP